MATKRSRISWKLEGVEKTFLEACVHELTLHGREGGSLKALSWKRVAEKLQLEHKFIADQKQMKNRYDYLKAKFTVWTKLKNKTGNVYDPITNMFNLSEEDWQFEIKSNKHAEALRSAPLAYPDLCIQLFEGSTSTGFDSWGPSSTLSHPFEDIYEHNLNDFVDIECTQMDPPLQGVSEESSGHSKKEIKKRKAKETMTSQIMEVGEHIKKLATMIIENHNASNDMEACMTKLGTMGWDESDAKYQTALMLFGESADIRKVWLQLQPQTCELWVKNAGAKLDMHSDDDIVVFILLCWYWLQLVAINANRIQDLNSSLTGHEYTQELLHGTSTQCHEMMRVSREDKEDGAVANYMTKYGVMWGTLVFILFVAPNSAKRDDLDSIGKRVYAEYEMMESETSRRVLLMGKRYISYETLKRDVVPCGTPGSSYYNCNGNGVANPYNRGCEIITFCARDAINS
ncbi:hypothetical protein E3N88_16588 [Mikania micrantha]|uniref:Myb/SANT-like domain-containing protein n=1 Tax=Mikania micrantha TaxID=192012 RepID=A0A5N6P027_9ASTR|nr:hypothetical protein E3N88_16588 [Mikania micrantha]